MSSKPVQRTPSRLRRPRLAGLASLLPFLLLAVPAPAQEGGDTSSPVFFDTVDVEVVNIDVHVTDKSGEPVRGLTKDDFELFVDGEPVAISNFYPVADGSRVAPPARVDPEAPPTEPPAGDQLDPPLLERAVPPEQRLHVVIYVDNFNLTQFNRNRVMRELREFLRRELSAGDEVMLVSYDRALHVRHPFTVTPERLSQAMLELEDISAQRTHRDRERQDLIAAINDIEQQDADVAVMRLQHYAGSFYNDMSFTIDALGRIVENLAGSPGRKAVVYVSDGIPMIVGEDMFYLVTQRHERRMSLTEMTEYDLSRRFRQLAANANANRVTFYTIDARGLTVSSSATVDQAHIGSAGQMGFIDTINNSNLQSPLQLLAEETGGRAILNANRVLPDLLKMGRDFRNYYSLGYAPPVAGDGRYHRIEVRLRSKGQGYQIRHRSGYRDKSVESRMIEGTLSALNLNMQNNPLQMRIQFGRPKPRSDGNYDAPVYLQIPFAKLTLVPGGGEHRGRLRIFFAAKDEQDKATEVQEIPVDISIPSDRIAETEGKHYTYGLELTMERGYHDLAIGLRDELGAQYAFVRRGVDIAAP
ncbi:MAG TPA: VWA domain-containing protein [Thermoanaerobaculia bacterium]|nr:VWA domain-containing protein [Thermoanaerobaculia bacterium]